VEEKAVSINRRKLGVASAALAVCGLSLLGIPAAASAGVAHPAASAHLAASAHPASSAHRDGNARADGGYVTINGSGSSWSEVALDQWSQDVESQGITVNFNPDGSAEGRQDYIDGQDDFAASDPPFRDGQDKLAQTGSEIPFAYGYSYIPDTAGGTAFMYHLDVDGKQITNMRLSGLTLMKIFTGKITNWDNPEITKEYGAQLPSIPITPVVRSDGSGATFFFTRWMSHMYPQAWNAFCAEVTHGRVTSNCGQTEFYPTSGWSPNVKAENGSNNVADYITSAYANGAIGYDEYAYALNSHYPVVAMLNPAGYYVLPTASNVAVALTQAQIVSNPHNIDFLQQNLDNVYTYTDPRSYPLSSYSYLIVPKLGTKQPPTFSDAKGKTLSTFVDFFLCGGQRQVSTLGYSPLPMNLVKGGLLQSDRIPGHIAGPNINTLAGCPNPTFSGDVLTVLKDAPEPSPCQKDTAPLNCKVVDGKAKSTSGGSGSTNPSSGTSPSAGTSTGTGTGTGSGPGGSSTTGTGSSTTGGAAGPVTGQVVNVASDSSSRAPLGVLTALAIVAAVAAPPVLGLWLRRRRVRVSR
jgi:ABC-type phosphate transport system substrate-binding protein